MLLFSGLLLRSLSVSSSSLSSSYLKLLSSLLIHRFKPLKGSGNKQQQRSLLDEPSQTMLTKALAFLLDGDPNASDKKVCTEHSLHHQEPSQKTIFSGPSPLW